MNKIVFINPFLSTEDRYGIKSQGGGQTPPLGLANLAAMTRKHGFETAIIDASALKIDAEEVANRVKLGRFDYVGITAVTISIGQAAEIARLVKAMCPEVTTILGGSHLTAVPEETMSKHREFDIGVVGEGDYTIIDLLKRLEAGKSIEDVPGLIVRNNGSLIDTGKRPRIENLDDLPPPAFDLLPDLAKHYCPPVHTVKRLPGALLVASRGCPGQCIFCDRSVFGNKFRAYSPEYTFELIKDLYENHGIREIQLRDDNFTASHSRILGLCDRLDKADFKISWTCASRVDMVNPSVLKRMKKAGCWQIWYGIESGSQSVLDAIKKRTTIAQIKKAIRMTKDAGISPCGFFIIGNPRETKESLEATKNFALELPLDEVHFCFMTPFPGTELYNRITEFGSFENDWSKLTCWSPVFVPKGLTIEDLKSYSKRAFWRFYFRPRIILSYLKKIRSWQHLKVYFHGFVALIEWLWLRKR